MSQISCPLNDYIILYTRHLTNSITISVPSPFSHIQPSYNRRWWYFVPLDMKGCICNFTKWQIHPFLSKGTIYYCINAAPLFVIALHSPALIQHTDQRVLLHRRRGLSCHSVRSWRSIGSDNTCSDNDAIRIGSGQTVHCRGDGGGRPGDCKWHIGVWPANCVSSCHCN